MSTKSTKELMEYRFLGRSGIKISVISFGAWITFGDQIDENEAYNCMKTAYDNGCNFFDNAEVYGAGKAETVMGNVFQRMFKQDGIQRSDLIVSTKLFWATANYHPLANEANLKGLSRKRLIEGTRASLKRLQLDYVDVIFAHRSDPYTPMEEIVRGFNWLLDKGYAFYWGTSEWPVEDIRHAHEVAEKLNLIGPVVEQPQYNMLHRKRFEIEYSSLYKDIQMGTTIWSPLASGLLSGKYSKDLNTPGSRFSQDGGALLKEQLQSGEGMNGLEMRDFDRIMEIIEHLKPIAKRLGCTMAQLSIAWAIKNSNVTTVITGASRASQVAENFQSLAVAQKLSDNIMEEIEQVLKNKPAPPKDWRTIN